MTFKRTDSDGSVLKVTNFDSSPAFSLCKEHGWREDTFRLERTGGNTRETRYDVYASSTESGKVPKVGTLTAKTRDAIWAGQ